MNFIKVTAVPCNAQGTTSNQGIPIELHLNIDLVGAIRGQEILLKGGFILPIGNGYFTNIRLGKDVKLI